jgi:protein-tyrosine phosphatase
MTQGNPYPRNVNLESVDNFRDLGGYRTQDGRMVIWRHLYRSGELHRMTKRDLHRLEQEIGIRSVLDLRNARELERRGIGRLSETNFQYYSVPLAIDDEDKVEDRELFQSCSSMGEIYLYFVGHKEYGRRLVEALEVIAEPTHHPLVFHCAAGKDRTGVLAAILLSVLGVADQQIVEDYTVSGQYMKTLANRLNRDPETANNIKELPGYVWEAEPKSMFLFLSTLRQEYGSVTRYLEVHGAESSLTRRLEKALLT